MRDCSVPTATSTCREHNVHYCWVCLKEEGCCDYGGCHKAAETRIFVAAVRTGEVVETRPLCLQHAEVFSLNEGGHYTFSARPL